MASTPVISVDAPSCPVSGVVVYLDRADVTRSIEVDLSHGDNEVVVKQLSSAIDSDSIRVEGRGLATIGEVKYQVKHVSDNDDGEDDIAATETTTSSAQAMIKEMERERDRLATALRRMKANGKRIKRQREILDNLVAQMNASTAVGAPPAPPLAEIEQFQFGAKAVAKKKVQLKVDADSPPPAADVPTTLYSSTIASSSVEELISEQSLQSVVLFMEFYSKRTRELDEKLAAVRKEKAELKGKLLAITSNLELRGTTRDKRTRKGTTTHRSVSISVTAEKGVKATLYLSYVVMDAGWEPQYDLRVFSKDQKLKIHYFALISQSTGEDWNDAPLVLSTAQPSIGGSPPQLDTKKLSFVQHIAKRQYNVWQQRQGDYGRSRSLNRIPEIQDVMTGGSWNSFGAVQARGQTDSLEDLLSQCCNEQQAQNLRMDEAEVTGTVTSTSFEIPRRTTIPADQTKHKVAVAIVDLEPEFEYETVPKRVAHAFLKAQVKNTSQFAFLQGPANVFLDNNFISKTSLDDVSPYEKFTCSLGVDPAVRVVYKPVRRYKETTGLFSKSTVVRLRQSIDLNNTRLDIVKIKVTDVLPITSEDSIKVGMLKPEVSRKDPSRSVAGGHVTLTKDNLLEWQLEIAATTQHTVEFSYNVEYPANKHDITGL